MLQPSGRIGPASQKSGGTMKLRYVALALGLGAFANAAAAEYPSQTVTIVVPFGPGGSNDTVGRYLADQLSELWGQPVVVENRPGAGAVIGANHVAKADPDGHTLLVSSVTFTTTPAVQQNLPYDPAEDLAPVAMLGKVPMVLGVGPSVEATTIEEFLEIARSRDLAYADVGPGSINQFAAELLNEAAGLELTPVHYSGGTEAMTDLIGGHVDLYFGTIVQLLPTIEGGQLSGLLVTSPDRSTSLPDVPTPVEAGLAEAQVEVWWGLFAPGGTPDDIINKVNADINSVLSTPEAKEFLAGYGARPASLSAEEFTAHVQDELQKWRRIAEEQEIKAE
ncbi:MAG TPA: tripartite tricarboxylate transporter substrate binding protein [Nitrospira sp.]|nr:tripartite tricarboxylate transporter substrate binding protein [Nitrospira sp.]